MIYARVAFRLQGMKRAGLFVLVLITGAGATLWGLRALLAPEPLPAPPPSAWRAELARVDLRVLFTGQTQSYLDVCGCASAQEGGLGPRGTLLARLRAGVPACLTLDAGGLLGMAESLDVARAEVTLLAMADLDYDAVLLSGADLVRGYDLLAGLAQDSTLEFLSCNLQPTGDREAFWSPFRVLDRNGVTVAVVGLTRQLPHGADEHGFHFVPYTTALAETLTAVAAFSPDLLLLLCDLAPALDAELLARLPEIDLVLTHGSGETADQVAGLPVLYSVPKGKRLTWADAQLTASGALFSATEASVAESLPKDPTVQARLEAFYADILSQYGPAAPKPLLRFAQEQDAENFYLGSGFCKDCHQAEYAQWERTTHSVAYNLLYARNRHYVPDVFAYYVTGFGAATGFDRVDAEHPLAQVGCETCHGPGGKHAAGQKKEEIRGKVGREICAACHVPAWDPHFAETYAERRKAILHR